MERTTAACLLSAALLALSLSACTGGGTDGSPVSAAPAASVQGTIFGGQQPVVGSTVTVYAAGASYGTATALSPTAVTDANGAFNLSFTCPAGSPQLYVVASGGNPGFGVNSAAELSAAVGRCDEATLPAFLVINEVTTVASVYALSQFLNAAATQAGAPETNTLGLDNAVSTLANLADVSTGVAATALVTGASGTPPTATINTLANIIAACVNSNGPASSPCTTLFSNATPAGGTAPTTTLQATLNIARNPGINVAALYALNDANGPFQTPAPLAAAPNDWTLGISFFGGAIVGGMTQVAIDGQGNVWAVNDGSSGEFNNGLGHVVLMNPQGAQVGPFFDAAMQGPNAIGIDTSGNAFVTGSNFGANAAIFGFSPSGQPLPGSPFTNLLFAPVGIAIDAAGNVWTANTQATVESGADSSVTKLTAVSAYTSSNFVFRSDTNLSPSGLALDAAGNIFPTAAFAANQRAGLFGLQASDPTQQLPGSPYEIAADQDQLQGAPAFDPAGNIWQASPATGITRFSSTAGGGYAATGFSALSSGVTDPGSFGSPIAIDSAGKLWVANNRRVGSARKFGVAVVNNDGSEFAGSPYTSSPVTPDSNTGGASRGSAQSVALDASGNVWVTGFFPGGILELVGAATPVKTPLIGLPQLP